MVLFSLRQIGDFGGIDAFLPEQGLVVLQSFLDQFILGKVSCLPRRLRRTENAMHAVSDAGITWILPVASDFPLRTANAGVGGLCQ
jgi:hypothetical protein